jgi:hypothetical protein
MTPEGMLKTYSIRDVHLSKNAVGGLRWLSGIINFGAEIDGNRMFGLRSLVGQKCETLRACASLKLERLT